LIGIKINWVIVITMGKRKRAPRNWSSCVVAHNQCRHGPDPFHERCHWTARS
jgi:hypothetical protein